MNDDDTKNNYLNQEDIPQNPQARDAEEAISFDEIRVKVILTPAQIAEMNGEFPFERRGTRVINGDVVEVIEELYRIDALGNMVRNDDIGGFSWSDTERKNPIPSYLKSKCANPWEHHGLRLVYPTVDGDQVGDNGIVLCTECLIYLKKAPFIKKILYKRRLANL